MGNLRLIDSKVISSTSVVFEFTENLSDSISASNFYLRPVIESIPIPAIENVSIIDNIVYLTTDYLTPYAKYEIILKSTEQNPFVGTNGDLLLFSTSDKKYLLGFEDSSEPIRNNLIRYLSKNIYSLNSGTLIRDILNSDSKSKSQILFDIKELSNDIFLDRTIFNEPKVRGDGPFDRLNEGGAFEILKISKNLNSNLKSYSKQINEFPSGPISLQAVSFSETLSPGVISGTFDKLLLRLSKFPVSKLTALTIIYEDSTTFEFPVETISYQLKNSRYDELAANYILLEDNEILLGEDTLKQTKLPGAGDSIQVEYEYLLLGKSIDESTVEVYQNLQSIRESAPPITTYFTLKYAPILDINSNIPELAGVSFLDPESNPPFGETHPAFLTEKRFDLDALPQAPGEYAIEYSTGKVFVYGAEDGDGTGVSPPACTYRYKNSFTNQLDFIYDPETKELVSSPARNLTGEAATIAFSFEDLFIPGLDFNPQIHQEVINERVNNKITSTGSLTTVNSPITNVFRLFNETTGEVYSIQRWNDYSVFFSSKIPPRVKKIQQEKVNFSTATNETLFVSEEVEYLSKKIFKIQLLNAPIIGFTNDCIGSSFNTSVSFSDKTIFQSEIYYDDQDSLIENYNRLSVGKYFVDYLNGTVYIEVDIFEYNIGSINYSYNLISTENKRIVAIDDLYFYFGVVGGINKKVHLNGFTDTEAEPSSFNLSNERFLNGDKTLNYVIEENSFSTTDDGTVVRGLYDLYDLKNNAAPTNFADGATISTNTVSLEPITKISTSTISGFTVNIPFVSDGAEITEILSVIDSSNNELWNAFGSFTDYTITLNSSHNDTVLITYKIKLNGSATIVIDYSRGDYLIDYTYLMDEIVISYEYGNNLLDFREMSKALTPGDQYYVSYRVGALRNALLNNFGSLFDVPSINHTDLNILREAYRDILSGAMGSTTKGPTVLALKDLVKEITHISPELIEAAFENWSLGASYFYPNLVDTVGDIKFLPGKYEDGFYVSESGQSVSLPAVSNFRIEEGTFEAWVLPDWKGFDNDAELTLTLLKNNVVLSASSIFIGRNNHHPTLDLNHKFKLLKKSDFDSTGRPTAIFTETGVFIYFDEDVNSWKFLAKDSVNETNVYSGMIETSGEFYGVKNIENLGEINDILRSGKKTIEFEFNIDALDASNPDGYDGYVGDGYFSDGYVDGYHTDGYIEGYSFDGITFKSDLNHYIFDFGKTENKNRLSIFKDGSGYIVFQAFDKFGNRSELSSNIKVWNSGEKHHIATSWKLNTVDGRDEMHLFIDGFETPNILKYGNRPLITTSDKYRSPSTETILYSATRPSVSKADLSITAGSTFVVSSETNFEDLGVVAGDILRINESGFEDYTILSVSGYSLEIDQALGSILTDVDYSINPVDVVVSTQVALYTNIALYIVSDDVETELPGKRANIPGYEISKNDLNQDVVSIYGNFVAGDKVVLRTLGLNHRRVQENIYLWSDSSIIKTQLPEPISLDEVKITAAPLSSYVIGPNSSTGPGIYTGSTSLTQPTNSTEGRRLSVKINGGNIKFSTPVSVTIHGTIFGGGTSEVLVFSANGTKSTVGKFKTLSTVDVSVLPIIETKDFLVIEIFEKDPITVSQDNDSYPIISYSYISQIGTTLSSVGTTTLTDNNADFLDSVAEQTLVITSGIGAGEYSITERINQHTIKIDSILPVFSNAEYKIYYSGLGDSAFQNGYFTFLNIQTITPYILPKGYYNFDYSTYLTIKIDPLTNENIYFGSNMFMDYPVNAVLDEIRILSKQLTDVRTGESPATGQDYISKDFQRKKQFSSNKNTLVLIHGNDPLINSAKFFVSSERDFIQSGNSINAEFNQSIFFDTVPLIIDNAGILNNNSGTIEFWVSPKYDTINDPKTRYYFDASSYVTQEVYSITKTTVILPERVASIFSVTSGSIDYFKGGKLLPDGKTIQLGKPLDFERILLTVAYLPLGLSGDRLSIYKDASGYIVFELTANKETFQLKSPILWDRGSWHRIAATYTCNSKSSDKLEFFIDGNESGMLTFGSGALFGQGNVFGQSWSGPSSITGDFYFKDPINLIHLGSDFREVNIAQARMDNLRISNVAKSFWTVSNQRKDLNYSSNIENVLPVIEDLYTTYLLNFNSVVVENTDMTIVRDEINGIFNFALNIIDSFGILAGNSKIKDILESLIKLFKPSESKVRINYL